MTDLPKRVVMIPITITINPVVWQEALDLAATVGATHRLYGDPVEGDADLWFRVQHRYNTAVRRWPIVNGKVTPPTETWEPLPASPPVFMLAEAREAYQSERADVQPYVDLERLAKMVNADGNPQAYVEQTGGGCATIYAGPRWKDEHGDERWSVVVGPGWFDGPGWTQGYASYYELWIGRDDDGVMPSTQVPAGATLREIADLIALQVKATAAQNAIDRAARDLKAVTLERAAGMAALQIVWQVKVTDEQAEVLFDEVEPEVVAGESDWRLAVTVYRVPQEFRSDFGNGGGRDGGTVVAPGTYVRTSAGKEVQCWRVGGVDDGKAALAYATAVEALYQATNP